ncbi:MAG: PAC2 family protein [Firmicutes bacterium]|jgi:hypothetical protein|nr:PAC2 family protein [Bacillota bacterium]
MKNFWKFRDGKHIRYIQLPKLSDATMIVAFEGWNDAGSAASLALAVLRNQWKSVKIAEVDSEEFFNFTEQRPEMYFSSENRRYISWPKTTISLASSEKSPGDVIFVYGAEPQLKWKTYSSNLYKLAKKLNCRRAIFLGSHLADITHDVPVQIAVSGDITPMGIGSKPVVSGYEGPIGILSALQTEFENHNVLTGSIWAGVPNYSESTSPKAALALVLSVNEILKGTVSTVELERLSKEYETRMTNMVDSDELLATYVSYVSERNEIDTLMSGSGEVIQEIEDFLRKEESN